jgi:uncharacterized protein
VSELDAFPPDVIPKLKTYVYRLIDPRNGETFYVGKGQGNRVFAHIRDELSQDGDELSDKLKRIREVRLSGFEVAHVIHRHGMDDATAFEVEAGCAMGCDRSSASFTTGQSTASLVTRR